MAPHPKRELLFEELRRKLRAGAYLPGQRIDPAPIAAEYGISLTPVRGALHMLLGANLIEDHGLHGVYVPLPSTRELRDAYDWIQHVLSAACENDTLPPPYQPPISPDVDPAQAAWELFDALSSNEKHPALRQIVQQANDFLAPVRHAKKHLITDAHEELSNLHRLWTQGDLPGLQAALHAYHDRRKQMAPRIVDLLVEKQRDLRDA